MTDIVYKHEIETEDSSLKDFNIVKDINQNFNKFLELNNYMNFPAANQFQDKINPILFAQYQESNPKSLFGNCFDLQQYQQNQIFQQNHTHNQNQFQNHFQDFSPQNQQNINGNEQTNLQEKLSNDYERLRKIFLQSLPDPAPQEKAIKVPRNINTLGAEGKSFKKLRRLKRKANFNKSFSSLREKLNLLNCSRKFQFDSLLKKVKSKIFKTIYDSLRTCLRENYRLQRLPQSFITDIKIDSNKHFLHKSIKEIYEEFGIFLCIDKLLEEDYIKKDKLYLLSEFLSLSFVEVYHLYIESKQYGKDISKIVRREGAKFGELFKFIARNFLDYYLLSKGNKPKTKQERNPKHLFKVIHKKKTRGAGSQKNGNVN